MAVRSEAGVADIHADPAVPGQPAVRPAMVGGLVARHMPIAADVAGRRAEGAHASQQKMGVVLAAAPPCRQHLRRRHRRIVQTRRVRHPFANGGA
ncbi:hypothetical protein G6F65_020760 [Rhizopus arrhizus]|nr:hypothetical protein G6F65_020760 [Rhizopus arrhizus]